MARFMDNLISPNPIKVIDLTVDKSKLNIKSLTITEAGHLPGRILQKKNATFESWAFAYIAKGNGFYQVNDGIRQRVERGYLFFIYPGAEFHYGPEDNGNWDEYYIRFEGNRIQEWLHNWLYQAEIVKNVGVEEQWFNKLGMIFTLIESGVPINIDRASLLLESLLYEWLMKANHRQPNGIEEHIFHVIEDISNSLYQPIETRKLAERHHISMTTLRRMVSKYTGFPLNDYIHRLKIGEAKKILLNTNWKIKEVSYTLGYKDVFHFSRLFKKYAGISPQLYRRM
ncbi:MAG: AraC family transcriptional regulator [Paenibacillaceae bacterium]